MRKFFDWYSTHCIRALGLLAVVCLFYSCVPSKNDTPVDQEAINRDQSVTSISYAKGFDLVEYADFQVLHIFRHYNDDSDTVSYLLSKGSTAVPVQWQDTQVIDIPVQNIALLHSSYVAFFDFCNSLDYIKAISEGKYIYHRGVYEAIEKGDIVEVGFGESLDKEQLLALDIELIINVGWPNAPDKNEHLLNELGISQIVLAEWQEPTVLARAEWVKVIAALTGQEQFVADEFESIANKYHALKKLTQQVKSRPSVLCNLPYKGSWYVPGGNSFMSHLIEHAGARYLWSHDDGTGGIQLDFETVYAKGLSADYWINPGMTHSIQDLIDSDTRVSDFATVKSGKVFNSNARMVRGQANDYWESGLVNPHLILADLIKVFHPELSPGHKMVYFKKMSF